MSTLQGGPGNIVTNGLVLYLDAANTLSYTSGSTVWNDLSGNSNSGTLVNGPTFSSGNAGSIVFDGVDDIVDLGINTIGPLLNGTTGISLSSWINPSSLIGERSIIFIGIDGLATLATIQFQNNTLKVGGRSIKTDSFQNTMYSYATLNVWINFVGILNYTLDKLYIYLNGNLVRETNVTFNSSILVSGTPTISDKIGAYTNILYTSGKISNTQIYNRALSADEILQNYNVTKGRFGL